MSNHYKERIFQKLHTISLAMSVAMYFLGACSIERSGKAFALFLVAAVMFAGAAYLSYVFARFYEKRHKKERLFARRCNVA